jgi:hypothetical protein
MMPSPARRPRHPITLIRRAAALLALAALGSVYAHGALAQADAHSAFSNSLHIEYEQQQRTLLQTGQAVRKILFAEIYTMAHYLEADTLGSSESVYNAIVESPGIKQVTMTFSRALRAEQIQKSLRSGIRSNASNESYQRMLPDIEAFMNAIDDDVERSDEFVLRWYPDGTLQSFFQGNSIISLNNNDLAQTMWAMWFGERAVVDRRSLVERTLTRP